MKNKSVQTQEIIDRITDQLNKELQFTLTSKGISKESLSKYIMNFLTNIKDTYKEELQFNITQEGDIMNIEAANLYSLLVMSGVTNIMPYELKGLEEYVVPGYGTYRHKKIFIHDGTTEIIKYENTFQPVPIEILNLKIENFKFDL